MTKEERLDEALKNWDFCELAKITYERSNPMKIKVIKHRDYEELQRFGNRFFTKEQLKAIREEN